MAILNKPPTFLCSQLSTYRKQHILNNDSKWSNKLAFWKVVLGLNLFVKKQIWAIKSQYSSKYATVIYSSLFFFLSKVSEQAVHENKCLIMHFQVPATEAHCGVHHWQGIQDNQSHSLLTEMCPILMKCKEYLKNVQFQYSGTLHNR